MHPLQHKQKQKLIAQGHDDLERKIDEIIDYLNYTKPSQLTARDKEKDELIKWAKKERQEYDIFIKMLKNKQYENYKV